MNLELPFEVVLPAEFDEFLARIDRELDDLFLDEALEAFRAERPPEEA